ncbi:hypothetical protein GCM10009744_14160 [Kribbella alba]|uniref:Uncharacterized protein n=1 Tax=Kribbella alba TaxID=190197 RepID=A0ABN2F2W4_9ACTN
MHDTLTIRDTLISDTRTRPMPSRVPAISPDDAEAALLANYSALVRLAYLILPPTFGRDRRILAAHGVVQHALPERRRLERQLIGVRNAVDFTRSCVAQAAIEQARARTPLRWLPLVWAIRLFGRPDADDLLLDRGSPEARAAWVLGHIDATVFDPCSARLCPTELKRRNTRGRAVAMWATVVLTVSILATLIAAALAGR